MRSGGVRCALDWSASSMYMYAGTITVHTQRAAWIVEGACVAVAGGARGAAHRKHLDHVQDAGGVKAQKLVEGQRVLPRVASRAHGAERAAGREAGGGKRARLARSGQGRGLDCADIRGEARGKQRTANMASMVTTREVSKVRGWLKALAACRGSQAGHTVRARAACRGRREAASERGLHAAGRGEGWTVQISGAKRAGSSAPETCSASPSRVRCSSSAAG